MKKTLLPVAVLSLLLLCSTVAHAQKSVMKDAEKAFSRKEYYNACELYKKSMPKLRDKLDKAHVNYQIAECYRLMNDWKQAEAWYNKAIKANYGDANAQLHYADAKKFNGKYDEAITAYRDYQKVVADDPSAAAGITSSELALKWQQTPTRWKVENAAGLNSRDYDFSPAYFDRKHTMLVFTSKREGQTGGTKIDPNTGRLFSDYFQAKVDKNGKWSTPTPLSEGVNSAGNEGTCSLTKKFDKMYVTRCEDIKNKITHCHIYLSEKRGNDFQIADHYIDFGLDAATLDSFSFRHPALSPDETVMVFTSDMRTGNQSVSGSSDLWMSTYDKTTKKWGKPVNLGGVLNTNGSEGYPFIADDGTLYFASNGLPGMGGYDIYKAERTSTTKWEWGKPENMQSPINSSADDFGIIFDGKQDRGYITSNREGGKGADDIWSFYKPKCDLPLVVDVNDCDNSVKVQNASVRLTGSDGSAVEGLTDASGVCKFKLNPEVSYVVNVFADKAKSSKADHYFNLEESQRQKLTTMGLADCKDFAVSCCVKPPKIDIRLPRIEYDLRSAMLRPESKDSLNYLYKILTDNPTIVIELGSHTDCRGSDAANDKLSLARAQSVVDYLVNEKGIAKERLTAKGYGEHFPATLADGTKLTEQYIMKQKPEQREALHQVNRRTTFRVLRWDYVDPKNPVQPRSIIQPKVTGEENVEDGD